MALNDQERALISTLFTGGPRALLEDGYTTDFLEEFIKREDVRAHMAILQSELLSQLEIEARTKFMTRRDLASLAPGASAVLARALAGPVYARDANGNIMYDAKGNPVVAEAEPTPTQLRAAQTVVDTLGVKDMKTTLDHVSQQFDPQRMLGQAEEATKPLLEYPDDYTKEEHRAMSRERVRLALERLAPQIEDVHMALTGAKKPEEVEDAEVEEIPEEKPKRKVGKRKVKKKSA